MANGKSKIGKLKLAKRPLASLSEIEFVRTGHLEPGQTLPLLIQPNIKDIDPVGWAAANRSFIETKLTEHGALLFRGFDLPSIAEFEKFAGAACNELFGEYGDLPREQEGERVYQSTPYPEDKAILFHNESSHMHRWPMRQFFYCMKAAEEGGETPIVDCRRIYAAIPREILQRFEDKQIVYVRNFTEGLDISWQDFFKTDDPAKLEDYCRRSAVEYEWRGKDLRIRQRRPAIMTHPKSGEKVFFNQIQLHHLSCLAPEVREALLSIFTPDNVPRSVHYGDGSPIADSDVQAIAEIYWRHAVSFSWQQGDVLMLDNMLVAHARKPYRGARKIVVAMGDMLTEAGI